MSRTCFSFVSCRGATASQGCGRLRAPATERAGPELTSSSPREVTTASIIFRGLFTLETVSFPSEPSNCTAGRGGWGEKGSTRTHSGPDPASPRFPSGPGPGCAAKGALTWLVGVLQLRHLRCDEFSAFLLGTVAVDFLRCRQLLQLLEVVLRRGEGRSAPPKNSWQGLRRHIPLPSLCSILHQSLTGLPNTIIILNHHCGVVCPPVARGDGCFLLFIIPQDHRGRGSSSAPSFSIQTTNALSLGGPRLPVLPSTLQLACLALLAACPGQAMRGQGLPHRCSRALPTRPGQRSPLSQGPSFVGSRPRLRPHQFLSSTGNQLTHSSRKTSVTSPGAARSSPASSHQSPDNPQ